MEAHIVVMKRIRNVLEALVRRSPSLASTLLISLSQEFWEKEGEHLALSSFYETAEKVPAYRDFLLKHGLENYKHVKTIEDFKEMVPVMDKENYVKRYPLDQRSIKKIYNTFAFTTSGGTTADPLLVNHAKNEFNSSDLKIWLYYLLGDLSKRILLINSFAQGAWTGGVLSNFVFKALAEDPKINVSIVTPGLNVELVIALIDTIGEFYDIVLLAGYPSFFRLVYYEGVKMGLDWDAHKLILMCSGESVVNLKHFFVHHFNINPFFELLDIYSATEGGWMAFFTPLCNLIEGLYEQNPTYFGITGPASFFQYNPMYVYLEELKGELLITRDSSSVIMPVVRYKLSDAVKMYKYAEMENIWRNHFDIEPRVTLKKGGFSKKIVKWPFCVVRGRSDQSIIIMGANIHPDELTYSLNLVKDNLINNFKFGVEEDIEKRFVIYLELFPGVSISPSDLPKVTKRYHDLVLENLSKINIDFNEVYRAVPTILDPIIKICVYGEEPFEDHHIRVKPKHLLNGNTGNGN